MILIIEELIEEMHTNCPHCQGTGLKIDKEGEYSEDACELCDGKTVILSYDGERLRHLILKGELP